MSRYGLGLKLGVTSVTAAVARGADVHVVSPAGDGSLTTPAVAYAGTGRVTTGAAAERLAIGRPSRLAGRFLEQIPDGAALRIGEESYPASTLLAGVVRDVLTGVVDGQGRPPDRLCVTHPTRWPTAAADALETALRPVIGESGRLQRVPAAVAAGVDYAITESLADRAAILVCDMGATGFEVVRVGRRGSQVVLLGPPPERHTIGGDTFDTAVLQLIDRASGGAVSDLDPNSHQSAIVLQRLRRDCRLAKEALSQATATDLNVYLPAGPVQLRLTRDAFAAAIAPHVERFVDAIIRNLRATARTELAAIVLTGGSTQIPLVHALVDAVKDRPPVIFARYAAARGAAILASPPPVASNTTVPRRPTASTPRPGPARPAEPIPAAGPTPAVTAAPAAGAPDTPPATAPAETGRDPVSNGSSPPPAMVLAGGEDDPSSSGPPRDAPHDRRADNGRVTSAVGPGDAGPDRFETAGGTAARPAPGAGPGELIDHHNTPGHPGPVPVPAGSPADDDPTSSFLHSLGSARPGEPPPAAWSDDEPPWPPPAPPRGNGGRSAARPLLIMAAVVAAVLLVVLAVYLVVDRPGSSAAGDDPAGPVAPAAAAPALQVTATLPVGARPTSITITLLGQTAGVTNLGDATVRAPG